MTTEEPIVEYDLDIHGFFGLTYANYLVLHRSILQSMPMDWQIRFVKMLKEVEEASWDLDTPYGFRVMAVNSSGKFAKDPIPHYNRGRTRVELREGWR